MSRPVPALLIAFATACLALDACADRPIVGAGSSAAAPVYRAWSAAYVKENGESLDYEVVGSGAGMAKIRSREVDFGASDVIASPSEQDKDALVMFPTVITGVVPVVHLPHVASNALRLTGELLAKIYIGDVTRWDAPEIGALNPGLALAPLPIRLVGRSDASGTTYHFAEYMSRASASWKRRYGIAAKLDWPAGVVAAKGNGEVAKAVQAIVGAIGYVDYNDAVDDGLAGVSMKNADGRFVVAGVDGFREAAMRSPWYASGDFSADLSDRPGEKTWPITMGTYIAVPRVPADSARTDRTLRFVVWAYVHGDTLARAARFVPLPDKVQANAYREIARVRDANGNSIGLKLLAGLVK